MTFKQHDGGRAAAGFKGEAGDCGPRAAAIVTGFPYRDVYDQLFHIQKEQALKKQRGLVSRKRRSHSPRLGTSRDAMHEFMTLQGATWVPLRAIGEPPTRVQDCKARFHDKKIIMKLARHYSALCYGVNMDTWKQVDMKTVYGAWIMP